MTFEDSVEKNLAACLVAARVITTGRDSNVNIEGSGQAVANFDGVSLLIALSGGTDSTALILALAAIRAKYRRSLEAGGGGTTNLALGLELSACHVNHQLRGAEAAADEQFCRELCERLDVPLHTVDLEQVGEAEAELRHARYDALISLAKQLNAPYIVTAHNLDDQVETLLFRLIRGTSLRGLAGMSLARPLEKAPWPVLLRPMIKISRQRIDNYLVECEVTPRFDSSNDDLKYSRNFLRSQVVVPLKQRFPGVLTNIEQFRSTLESDNDCLAGLAHDLYGRALGRPNQLMLSVLAGAHEALIARVIATYIEQAGIMPSFQKVQRCMEVVQTALASSDPAYSARLSLGENLELLVSKDSILLKPLYELEATSDEYLARLELMAPVPVKMPRAGRSSAITIVPWLDMAFMLDDAAGLDPERFSKLERSSFSAIVDLRQHTGGLVLRPRLPGDRLQPLGMAAAVRLKQYLHANKALFAGARSLLPALNEILALRLFPVLADSQEVLWVPGFGISQKLKVSKTGQAPDSPLDLQGCHLISLVPIIHDSHNGRFEDEFGGESGGINSVTC